MGVNRRFVKAREQLSRDSLIKTGFWEIIMPPISQGIVIPIISNSFRIEQIFREERNVSDLSDETLQPDEDLTVEEQLAEEWAHFIEYPMPDVHNLSRVPQYFLVV